MHIIRFDNQSRNKKPTGGGVAAINRRLNKDSNEVEVTQQELFDLLVEGQTVAPAKYKGRRKADNWTSQSVFMVDFDDGFSLDSVLKYSKENGLIPNFWYYTFSHTEEKPKFRFVFTISNTVDDRSLALSIKRALYRIYKEFGADISPSKDLGRMYFGGSGGEIIESNSLTYQQLLNRMNPIILGNDSKNGKLRSRNAVKETWGTPLGTSSFLGSKPTSYIPYKELVCDPQTRENQQEYKEWLKMVKDKKTLQGDIKWNDTQERFITTGQWDEIKQDFPIIKDFFDLRWLYHDELIKVITNLLYLCGGEKVIKEVMKKGIETGKADYRKGNKDYLYWDLKKRGYFPSRLESDTTPFHTAPHSLFSTSGAVKVMEDNREEISLSKGEQELREAIDNSLNEDKGSITIIKAHTALGKTRAIEDLNGVTIAAPTHKLKSEINDRMSVDRIATPKQPNFTERIQEKINRYYACGLYKQAAGYIRGISRGQVDGASEKEMVSALNYQNKLQQSYKEINSTVITTHKRATNTEFRHKTLIFDECPLLSEYLNVDSVNINDIFALTLGEGDLFKKNTTVMGILKDLGDMELNEVKKLDVIINKEEIETLVLNSKNVETNVLEFLNADYVVRKNETEFSFIVKNQIPKNKNVVILSATAPVEIYKEMFGDRLNVVDVSQVKKKGKVIQNTTRSCSRQSINNNIQKVNKAVNNNNPTITFKGYDNVKGYQDDIYFGNCEGYDELKGQDINVVGLPHPNTSQVYLIAKSIGVEFNSLDTIMDYDYIDHTTGGKHFYFKFNTYPTYELRKIHLDIIESQLMQAVGRARVLREDVTVNVFSNYPLPITDSFQF